MKKILLALLAVALAGTSALSAAPAKNPASAKRGEGIVFLGDSITQGGKYLAAPVPSYRYQVFKVFADNKIAFTPMGMTDGARNGFNVSALTPDYRGIAFKNVSEAAASGRTYQYSGHPASTGGTFGETNFKGDPGSVANAANRGPVSLKLGFTNPYTKNNSEFYDGARLVKYTGETYKSRYGNAKPATLCVLLGINDIYDSGNDTVLDATAKWTHEIVRTYQKANPAIEVHVFKLLPTGKNNGTGAKGGYRYEKYNELLDKLDVAKKWSTAKSRVFLDDISAGFYAKDGTMCDTNGGAHPTAQGELIIAGNIARALGLEQRDCGFAEARTELAKLDSQIKFADASAIVRKNGSADRAFKKTGENGAPTPWKTNSGTLAINEKNPENNRVLAIDLARGRNAKNGGIVAAFKIKMKKSDAPGKYSELARNNRFTILCGNGADEVGVLGIGENGIFWNSNELLFGSNLDCFGSETLADAAAHDKMAGHFTKDFREIRIVCKTAGDERGFYVWCDGQLVGEKLRGNTDSAMVEPYKGKLVFGDASSANSCCAEVSAAAFEVK